MLEYLLATTADVTNTASISLTPATGMLFGGIVMAAFLVLKALDYFIDKARDKKKDDDAKEIIVEICKALTTTLAPVTRSLENLEKLASNTNDISIKSWALHNKFDEDGRPRWYIPHTLPDVLQQVSHTCERIVASQSETLKALRDTAILQQEILQNQKQFLGALQNFQNQQASTQQGLNLLIQQVMTGRSGISTEITPPRFVDRPEG